MEVARRHGELVICPDCGGKDWEIRMGALDSQPPSTATCSGCLGLWWLESSCDPADPRRVRLRWAGADEIRPVPDHVPDGLAS
jgi:hypothetical protein